MRTNLFKSSWALSLVLLLLLLTTTATADDETNEKSAADEKAKQIATTNSICSSCQCDLEKGILDCSDRNLSQNFKPSDFEALNNTMKLTNVFFKYNHIKNITAYPNVSIVVLDLSNNDIELIEPKSFANLALLVELNLAHNRLKSNALTPVVFRGEYDPVLYQPLKKLRVLNLAGNDLHQLDSDIFEYTQNLEDLDLSENPMMTIDSGTEIALTGLVYLKRLNLGNTQLRTLPEHLFHAPRGLIWVNLEGNLFQTIPEALLYAINLDMLILDENPIMRIGSKTSKFPVLTKLTKLSISNMNSLERIENHGLSNLENLAELNCTDNPKLNFIHSGALSRPGKEDASDTEWPPMRKLYLQNNNLSIIEADLIGRWDNMEEVDLSNNPWLCDCKTQWIIDVLLDKYGKAERNVKDVICQYPMESRGTKMIDLEHETLKCVDFKDGRVSRDGAVLVGVLIGVLVGVPIALMLFLIYKRGCFGLVANGPADFSRAFYKRTAQDDMNF